MNTIKIHTKDFEKKTAHTQWRIWVYKLQNILWTPVWLYLNNSHHKNPNLHIELSGGKKRNPTRTRKRIICKQCNFIKQSISPIQKPTLKKRIPLCKGCFFFHKYSIKLSINSQHSITRLKNPQHKMTKWTINEIVVHIPTPTQKKKSDLYTKIPRPQEKNQFSLYKQR